MREINIYLFSFLTIVRKIKQNYIAHMNIAQIQF